MMEKDFFGSERSLALEAPCAATIEFLDDNGNSTILKDNLKLLQGEVIDTAVMNVNALTDFYARQLEKAKAQNALFSLHLKATMMKVSDPIMFGHCVAVFFKDVLEKYAEPFAKLGVNVKNGWADVLGQN